MDVKSYQTELGEQELLIHKHFLWTHSYFLLMKVQILLTR